MSDNALDRVRRFIDNATGTPGAPGSFVSGVDAAVATPDTLTLDRLASEAGLSSYHFSRQFTARFSISPIAYVRLRRLTIAADRLSCDRSISLIDLAFDTGFDSQEAFTRAFKRAFGVPPGQYRRERHHIIPESLMSSKSPVAISLTQLPTPVRKDGLRIAGFSSVFDDATKSSIPLLWQRLIPALPVSGQISAESFGVCMGIPGQPGTMRYLAGVPIAADAPAPAGFEVVDITPRAYLVFRQLLDGGDLHPQMSAAAREIWGQRLPQSGYTLSQAPDLEFYTADFMPNKAGVTVEWWIPVEA